jgi:cytochrome oxidase Cu insertion factor (SCO1/SenC/PrrC family)
VSRWPIALSFVGGLAVAGGGWALWPSEPPQRSSTELMNVLMWNREPVGGPFTLIDHDGRPRTDADFRGKLMLIYFGFTFCSNTCPTDLQAIAGSLDQLGAAGDAVQPLFITVDPEKDTPAQLKGYVRLFHPRMIGLTGSPKQIRKVANDYKVYYAKAEPLKRADVDVDHSGFTFLVGRDGQYLGFFPPGTAADRIATALRPHLSLPPQS